jgi:hypothetical protein
VCPSGAARVWARLIKQVCEVDPLLCPQCTEPMRIVAFIEQLEIIEKILSQFGLRPGPARGYPLAGYRLPCSRQRFAAGRSDGPFPSDHTITSSALTATGLRPAAAPRVMFPLDSHCRPTGYFGSIRGMRAGRALTPRAGRSARLRRPRGSGGGAMMPCPGNSSPNHPHHSPLSPPRLACVWRQLAAGDHGDGLLRDLAIGPA